MAQVLWVTSVKAGFDTPHAWMTHSLRPVVSALTDRLDIAEYCFRVSIIPFFLLLF